MQRFFSFSLSLSLSLSSPSSSHPHSRSSSSPSTLPSLPSPPFLSRDEDSRNFLFIVFPTFNFFSKKTIKQEANRCFLLVSKEKKGPAHSSAARSLFPTFLLHPFFLLFSFFFAGENGNKCGRARPRPSDNLFFTFRQPDSISGSRRGTLTRHPTRPSSPLSPPGSCLENALRTRQRKRAREEKARERARARARAQERESAR